MIFSSLNFLYGTIEYFLTPESVQTQFSLNVRDGNLFYIYHNMDTSFIAKIITNTNKYIVIKYISLFFILLSKQKYRKMSTKSQSSIMRDLFLKYLLILLYDVWSIF